MTMNYALSVVNELKKKSYKTPTDYYGQKKMFFEYQSYKRSAIKEIEMYLIDHKDEDPIDVLEGFRRLMDNFSCRAPTGEGSFMFSVYYDVATDVLDKMI